MGGILNLLKRKDKFENWIERGLKKGIIDKYEFDIIKRLRKMKETKVREIMIPRPDVVALEVNSTIEKAINVVSKEGYSRLPVYEKVMDNILGILYIKDLLKERDREKSIRELLRKPYYVPESKDVRSLLFEMKEKHIHLAIVFDEFGGVAGIVTLEDIIEEILGEIYDEGEKPEIKYEVKDGVILASGDWDIDEMNQMLGTDIVKENFETVGGFIIHKAGRIPFPGEMLKHKNVVFYIEDSDGKRIKKVRIYLEE